MEIRFGVETGRNVFENMNREQYALSYKERIFERARVERTNYQKYLDELNLWQYRKAALIDTTAAGTVQTNLQHFMELPIKGYYFLKRISEVKENNEINFKSYYPQRQLYEIRENVFADFLFMELALSSEDATLICFDQNGKPKYAHENKGKEEKAVLRCIQGGVLRYFEDICNIHLHWNEMELDRDFADEILGTMNWNNLIINDDKIKNLVLDDYFTNIERRACERL